MKFLIPFLAFLISGTVLWSQVPEPVSPLLTRTVQKQPTYLNSVSWLKTGDDTYSITSDGGIELNELQFLSQLSSASIATLHLPSRTIILLPDFDDVAVGSRNDGRILLRNTSKNFYLTNPNSYITYVDDKSYTVDVTRVADSYVAYVPELDKTYFEKDIRKFSGWGADNLIDMGYAPDNTYWYRDYENKKYGIIIKGQSMDYTNVTSEVRGNDRLIFDNGKPVYLLKDYENTTTIKMRPVSTQVEQFITESSGSSNCVRGDCQDGFGKYEYNNGYYDGFWSGGKKSGYGLYSWESGATYIGNWEDDNMNGYGVFTDEDDNMQKGLFRNGKLHGRAVKNYDDDWEQGVFDSGSLVDSFTFYGNDVTSGCTIGDCKNKYGKMVFDNGDTFVGFFRNGNLQMGTYSFASGAKYSGQFDSSGRFSGMGRFWFANGNYYGGSWNNGKFDGRGYFSDKETGENQIGYFKNGDFIRAE